MLFNVRKEDCREIGVYSITNNINNKIYVGSTTTNFRHRYLQYKSGFLKKLDNQPVLYRAFRKYGFENFTFEILCITDKENALVMEQFYINKGVDYNSCLIAGSLSGFRHPDNSKTRTIIGGLHHCAKPIYQFTLAGELIDKYPSIIDAVKAIGKTKNSSSHLVQCCIGKTYSAFGFRWSFNSKVIERANRLGKHAININNGVITKDCNSQKEAALIISSFGFKCGQGRINRSILKTREKVYGFIITKIN